MLDRCSRKKNPAYKHYGGRGIKVCKHWKQFENFYADMGPRPSADLSLDRIDNDKGYSLDNCRWATKEEQNNNYRDTIKVLVDGVETPLAILARQRGINHGTLSRRWHIGWPEELLFSKQDHRIKFVEVEGVRLPLRKALAKYGVKICTYNKRKQLGWTDAEALLEKVRDHG